MANANSWFDIVVTDLDRAVNFYETLLAQSLRRERFHGTEIAIFPHDQERGAAGGCLVRDARGKPGPGGTIVYLDTNGKLDACLERVGKAGGQLVVPKTDIGQAGFFAIVRDTEGNTIGLHSER